MGLTDHFSTAQLKAIESAVQNSEKGTSGEIVPVFVASCARYPQTYYKAAILLGLLVFAILILLERYWLAFPVLDLWLHFLVLIGAGALGAWLVHLSAPVRRFFAGPRALQEAAFIKAQQFFLREEVFNTEQRTGIMIFVAKFEHQVIVEADEGINRVVPQEHWNAIVAEMIQAIKRRDMAQGIIVAVNQCADLLREKGMEARPDDRDELSNELRTEN